MPEIRFIDFFQNSILLLQLNNGRLVFIPLDKFPVIQKLNADQKKDFEIIDGNYLSFLSIDEIFSIEELIGF